MSQVRQVIQSSDDRNGDGQYSDSQSPGSVVKYDMSLKGDWTAWGQLLFFVPFLVLSGACLIFSLLPLFLILWNAIPGHWLIPVVAYYATGLLFFVPAIENFMWNYLDRSSRPPSLEERQRLDPVWNDVISRVGRGSDRKYTLRVTATQDLNAYAAGGRQVVVTQGALQNLNRQELTGVLAHELGHHAGLHPVVALAFHWARKPVAWAHWVSVKLQQLSILITNLATSSIVFWIFLVLALLLRFAAFILRSVVYLTDIITLWFTRQAEYRADTVAFDMGFGHGLLSALYIFENEEFQQGHHIHESALQQMLSNTHPPTHKRIDRLQKLLQSSS